MSKSNLVSMSEMTAHTVSPETMIKRVFGVAKLLASAQYQRDAEDRAAKNRVKNQRQDELRYCEDELTIHTA